MFEGSACAEKEIRDQPPEAYAPEHEKVRTMVRPNLRKYRSIEPRDQSEKCRTILVSWYVYHVDPDAND